MKKFSKKQSEDEIKKFFDNINSKSPKEIKKIRRLAMSHNIKLRKLKKLFCKKCYTAYKKPKIRIKNKIKSITCEKCGYVSRWGI